MKGLISAEWIKLRSRWMPRILLLILTAILGLLFLAVSFGHHRSDLYLPRGLIFSMGFTAFFLTPFLFPVLAGTWSGNEYSWGTIRMLLTRRPNRIQQILAGLVIIFVFVVAALLVALIVGAVGGLIVGGLSGHFIDTSSQGLGGLGVFPKRPNLLLGLVETFFGAIFVIMFYSLVAFAAGTIFHSPAAGIGIGIGLSLADPIVADILRAISPFWGGIADHFPYQYASEIIPRIISSYLSDNAFGSGTTAGATIPIIGVCVYSAVIVAIMFITSNSRDVTS